MSTSPYRARTVGLALVCLLLAACGSSNTAPLTQGSVGDAGPESAVDATSCATPDIDCSGACVDVSNDAENCGTCGHLCAAGEVCQSGVCSLTCAGGATKCGNRCVDLYHDPANCGACANACSPSEACDNGACVLDCVGGTTKCGQLCATVTTDPANCGQCGNVCDSGQVCVNGTCGLVCPPGTTDCDGACIDTSNNANHCGSCSNTCPTGQLCQNGSCGLYCSGGSVECNGKCVDTMHDPDNCGQCGKACGVGYECLDGKCAYTCGTDSLMCGSTCVDPLTDPQNCGGCGKSCPSGQVCVNGTCGMDCGNLSACGTECVDLQSDAKHCGQCSTYCAADRVCNGGQCVCAPGEQECVGKCVDTSTDPLNCGACGVGCNPDQNQVCDNSKCVCRPGTTSCSGKCVDTDISAANCGACGTACAAGKVCTKGACETPLGSWPTFAGNVAHTGANSLETGKPPLSLAWSYDTVQPGQSATAVWPAAVDGGCVFAAPGSHFSGPSYVFALNASDGTVLWKYNFGGVFSVGMPALFDGRALIGTGKATTGYAYEWAFDATSGAIDWSAPISAQWETYWAPIAANNVVYTNGGYYGGMYGFNESDGSQVFFTKLPQVDEWSPAYASGAVYTYISGILRAHDPASGNELWSTTVNTTAYSAQTAPVISGGEAYVIAPPDLDAINLTSHDVDWTANGAYAGTPMVSGGVVYGLSALHMVARDATTGALVGTFAGDGQLKYPPVAAGGYVYVASDANVYAVDPSTFKSVWTAADGGWLSIAEHRLFIARSDGKLDAYTFDN